MKLFGILFLFSQMSFAALAPPVTVKNDPYLSSNKKPTHELQVRIFQHGLKGRENLIAEQLRHAETLLSQCPGVVVKITPLSFQKLKSSTAQEKTIEFKGSEMYYSKNFLKFMLPFAGHRKDGPLNLHMTEYMDKAIRQTQVLNGQISYGQAYNLSSIHNYFKDPRPLKDQNPHIDEIMGNSLVLAIETLALQQKSVIKYPTQEARPRGYSLLAHEMGHLMLYDNGGGVYQDHFCPGINDYCDKGYLMSSGGNNDSYYTDKTTGKIVGYDPLPQLDNIQCERLKTSKYLQRL